MRRLVFPSFLSLARRGVPVCLHPFMEAWRPGHVRCPACGGLVLED